jgi:hypothetical protein
VETVDFTPCVCSKLQRAFWKGFQTPPTHALQRFFSISHNKTSWEFGTPFYGMGVSRQLDVSGLHERPGEASPNPVSGEVEQDVAGGAFAIVTSGPFSRSPI